MKTEEDEAFDDIARKQGAWGGGFQAKRKMAAEKLQEPKIGCVQHDCIECKARLEQPAQLAHIAQFMKELRPAIGPMATMGKSKTTQEWFDIVINEIERLQAAQEPDWKTMPPKDAPLVQWVKEQTAPLQREWVDLTPEEIDEGNKQSWVSKHAWQSAVWWASEKLKEKNSA